VALAASAAGGVATLLLVRSRRYGPARLTAAAAVAAIVAGWAVAQRPVLLPGLTVEEAAAGRATLIAVLVAAAIGAVVLLPQLFLLFRLFLRGTFDASRPAREREAAEEAASGAPAVGRLGVVAVVLGVVGVALTMLTDGGWPLGIGVVALLAFVATGFVAIVISAVHPPGDQRQSSASR
jgi:cytochrome d ubiquinol oxidase subunit II